MKSTIISDTHLGDPECTLFGKDQSGNITDKDNFKKLLHTMGKDNDYLILLGDIMDFAIMEYEDVYKYGEYFFRRIKEEKAAKRIVYIPGNHDFNIWHSIEHESNVINQIKKHKPVRKFKMSVPFILDDRSTSKVQFTLAGVSRQIPDNSSEPYGGMFLDDLMPDNKPASHDYIPFLVAFPNAYLFTDDNTIIMTHGQYLESYWAAVALLYRVITAKIDYFNMKDYISINFPLCELGSIGIGQAGPLTDLALAIEKEVYNGKYELIENYISNAVHYIIKELKISKLLGLTSWAANKILKSIMRQAFKKMRNSDYITDLTVDKDKGCIKRIDEFISSSREEIDSLIKNGVIGSVSTLPDIFLFGHTHVPVITEDNKSYTFENKKINLLNTGGWLDSHGTGSTGSGPAVFIYESSKGISSVKF